MMRRAMHPRRRVVEAEGPRAGRGSVLGPNTTRRTAWWVLRLECGHTVERTVRYKQQEGARRGGTQHRSLADALPAPEKVRCEMCRASR